MAATDAPKSFKIIIIILKKLCRATLLAILVGLVTTAGIVIALVRR